MPVAGAVAQRVLVLAGVALLAGVGIFAGRSLAERSPGPSLPAAVPAPGGGWYEALAARGAAVRRRRTVCGHLITRRSMGVAHPVLPCDTKLYITYGGREVLTQVLGRGPRVPGHDFELTPALARRLGLRGTQPIRWRYAR
jgi:hypothetical protein